MIGFMLQPSIMKAGVSEEARCTSQRRSASILCELSRMLRVRMRSFGGTIGDEVGKVITDEKKEM